MDQFSSIYILHIAYFMNLKLCLYLASALSLGMGLGPIWIFALALRLGLDAKTLSHRTWKQKRHR